MRVSIYEARNYSSERQYSEAITLYLTVLREAPQDALLYCDEVCECLENLCRKEETSNMVRIIRELAPELVQIFRRNTPKIIFTLAKIFNAFGEYKDAVEYLDKLASNNRKLGDEEDCFTNISRINYLTHNFPSWHMIMVNDVYRNDCYMRALKQCLNTGNDIVFDIGSGTGLLSVFAIRSGCAKVFAIDDSRVMCSIASEVFNKNLSVEERGKVKIVCQSSNIYIPAEDEKATVLVSEIFDCCAFGEGILETYLDAHNRLALPETIFIPSAVSLYVTLVESPSIHKKYTSPIGSSEYVHNGDRPVAIAEHPYDSIKLDDYTDIRRLSTPFAVIGVDLTDREAIEKFIDYRKQCFIKATATGTVHCLIAHFRADLCEGVVLDSSSPDNKAWDYGVFPLTDPLRVNNRCRVNLQVQLMGKRLDIKCSQRPFIPEADIFYRGVPLEDIAVYSDGELSQEVFKSLPRDGKPVLVTRRMCFIEPLLRNDIAYLNQLNAGETYAVMAALEGLVYKSNPVEEFLTSFGTAVWWPIHSDGSLIPSQLEKFELIHSKLYQLALPPPVVFPGMLSLHCQLISSDRLSSHCRSDPSAHCGVDMSAALSHRHLTEYRDILLTRFEHRMFSEEFSPFSFELQSYVNRLHRQALGASPVPDPSFKWNTTRMNVCCTSAGRLDGVVYWWQTGSYSTKDRRVAAFVFKRPRNVFAGQRIPLRFDLYNGHMLMTLDDTLRF